MITGDELQQVVATLERDGISEVVVGQLRQQMPGRHFTYCLDDDIHHGKPVALRPGFAVYLVDSSDHCSGLTSDLTRASGFVLAEILE